MELDKIARQVWLWCLERNIQVSAAHLTGKINQEAIQLSKVFNDDLEWSLAPSIFKQLLIHFPDMSDDLFASRLNFKLEEYVSHRPELHVQAVDTFVIVWHSNLYNIFSPFSLMSKNSSKDGAGCNRTSHHHHLTNTRWRASLKF